MNELNNLIEKSLDKVYKDYMNDKVEIVYTPEFLIELLQEIKQLTSREEVISE